MTKVSSTINNRATQRSGQNRGGESDEAVDYQPTTCPLAANRGHILGNIVPNVSNPFFSEIVQHVEQTPIGKAKAEDSLAAALDKEREYNVAGRTRWTHHHGSHLQAWKII